MSFTTLELKESLQRAVRTSGYTQATPIQAQAIPAILDGRDVMAAAQTGTGKTAGFTLPLLQLLGDRPASPNGNPRALILTPTRELAAQIEESIQTYGRNENLSTAVVFGGVKINAQIRALRQRPDMLVATPGRLLDLVNQRAVWLNEIEILVLDEADRMLDMGFIRDIRKILALLPEKRQNLMFSATFSNEIRSLAKTICQNPVEIDVAPRNSTVDSINQSVYPVDKDRKIELLIQILLESPEQSLVFSRTKHGANKLAKRLSKDNIRADAIHGNKSQNQRTRALADFKQNKVQVLVATDIAARGIDIDQLAQVINFDLPNVPEDYVHRIGRTGRAGASGRAVSLVSREESKLLQDIERLINRKIERVVHSGFDPSFALNSVQGQPAGNRNRRRGKSGNPGPRKSHTGRRQRINTSGKQSRNNTERNAA